MPECWNTRTGLLWSKKAMQNDTAETEKRIVEELDFGAKTSKRVGWEAWEFVIVAPLQIEVTNASYGFEKDEHSYVVTVEEREGLFVPAACECPADQYNDEYDCKHKVAVASVGGPVLLGAAMAFTSADEGQSGTSETKTTAELLADGGQELAHADDESEDTCPNGEAWCPGPDSDDLPCWECFRQRDD